MPAGEEQHKIQIKVEDITESEGEAVDVDCISEEENSENHENEDDQVENREN